LKAQINKSSFSQLACILRVSSPQQLDSTSIFDLANNHLATLFPGGPTPFTHLHRTEHLEEALELALQYGVESEVLLTCSGSEWHLLFTDNPPADKEGTGL
jgi:hypothetical protein